MEFRHLISTMKIKSVEENDNLIKSLNISNKSKTITLSQINIEKTVNENLIFSNKKGISNSRNDLIKSLNPNIDEILFLTDDDIIYENDYLEKVKNAYEKNKDADIIVFDIDNKNEKRRTSEIKSKKINLIEAMKVSSNQITMKKSSLLKSNLKFDKDFGAGSKYFLGEDTIFIYDALKLGLKIYHENEIILEMPESKSSWFNDFDEKYFKSLGACYYRINKKLSNFLIYQFAIRKKKLYNGSCEFKNAIKYMKQGKKEYIRYLKEKEN